MGKFDKSLSGEKTMRDASLGELPTMRLDQAGIGRVDRYELLEKLGQGGFGAVYGARDTEAGILVALKALPPLISHSPEELDSVRANFALVSRLVHPGIANLKHLHKVERPDEASKKALGVSSGDYLVVMEYVPGSTLSAWRTKFPNKQVPVLQALEICRRIAEALDYAHSQKIIHRDVKPGNIMLSQNVAEVRGQRSEDRGQPSPPATCHLPPAACTVKVLDFGLAAEIRSSMSRVSREQGDSSGTRPYMAPEQWTGKRQGAYTDQYALAVLFYELVSGAVPFQSVFETGDMQLMRDVVKTEAVEPLDELDAAQNAALLRALAKEAAERFGSCGGFVEALAGGGVKPPKTQNIRKSAIGNRKSAIGLLMAAGLLVVGGYFSGWFSIRVATNRWISQQDNARKVQIKYEHEQQLADEIKVDHEPSVVPEKRDIQNQDITGMDTFKKDGLQDQRFQQLEADRIAAHVEMSVAKARYEQMEVLSGDDLLIASLYVTQDPFVASMRAQIKDHDLMLNSLLENYGENHPDVKRTRAARDELAEKLERALDVLKQGMRAEYIVAKAKYEALYEEVRTINGTSKTRPRLEGERLQKFEEDRTAARVEMLVEKARYDDVAASGGDNLLTTLAFTTNKDPFLESLRVQVRDKESALSSLLENYGENHPEVKQIQAELDRLTQRVVQVAEGLKKGIYFRYVVAKAKYESLDEELRNESRSSLRADIPELSVTERRASPTPDLQGISWSANEEERLVMIDGRLYKSGDKIENFTVEKILPFQVVLKDSDGTKNTISLEKEDRAASVTPETIENKPPVSRTYQVRPGDTLARIAGAVYGYSSRWRVIYEANRDKMSSENDLKAGQVLFIPALKEGVDISEQISRKEAVFGNCKFEGVGNRLECRGLSGDLLWVHRFDAQITTTPVCHDQSIFVGADEHLYALDIATGAMRWSVLHGDGPISRLTVSGSDYIEFYSKNYEWRLDAYSGKILSKKESKNASAQ